MTNKNPSIKRICPHCGETTVIEIDLKKDPITTNEGGTEKVVRCSGSKNKKCPMSFYVQYVMSIELISIRKAE